MLPRSWRCCCYSPLWLLFLHTFPHAAQRQPIRPWPSATSDLGSHRAGCVTAEHLVARAWKGPRLDTVRPRRRRGRVNRTLAAPLESGVRRRAGGSRHPAGWTNLVGCRSIRRKLSSCAARDISGPSGNAQRRLMAGAIGVGTASHRTAHRDDRHVVIPSPRFPFDGGSGREHRGELVFARLGPTQLITQAFEKTWLEGGNGEPAVATSIQAVTGESATEDCTGPGE